MCLGYFGVNIPTSIGWDMYVRFHGSGTKIRKNHWRSGHGPRKDANLAILPPLQHITPMACTKDQSLGQQMVILFAVPVDPDAQLLCSKQASH